MPIPMGEAQEEALIRQRNEHIRKTLETATALHSARINEILAALSFSGIPFDHVTMSAISDIGNMMINLVASD